MAIIDFHSHILPGIDDGSKTVEMSVEMLRMTSDQGVDVMVATPHFYAFRHRIEDFLSRRKKAYEQLKKQEKPYWPMIRLGAEVAFFPGISGADQLKELTIEGTNVLLLEMPFETWTKRQLQEVRILAEERKFQIVLAHLERYMRIPNNKKKIETILEMPLYIQINAESLFRWSRRRQILKMFQKGQADFLGSDCHRIDKREPNLGRGREILNKKLGQEFLKNMDHKGSRLLKLEEKKF